MGDILVSTSDGVPGKEIVSTVGNVSVKRLVWFNSDKREMVSRLQLEAELIGANAIVSMIYKTSWFFGVTERCSGLAVKVRDKKG